MDKRVAVEVQSARFVDTLEISDNGLEYVVAYDLHDPERRLLGVVARQDLALAWADWVRWDAKACPDE